MLQLEKEKSSAMERYEHAIVEVATSQAKLIERQIDLRKSESQAQPSLYRQIVSHEVWSYSLRCPQREQNGEGRNPLDLEEKVYESAALKVIPESGESSCARAHLIGSRGGCTLSARILAGLPSRTGCEHRWTHRLPGTLQKKLILYT